MTTENNQTEPKPEDIVEIHNTPAEDGATSNHQIATPPEDRGTPAPAPEPESEAYVDTRQAIAKRFQSDRAQRDAPVPSTGDHTDPTQLYGQFGKVEPEPEPEPQVEAEPPPTPAAQEPPRKFKLKIRHEEREFTEEEMIRMAQIGAAGTSYLDDAKKIYETTRASVSRPHQDAPAPTPAADTDPSDDPSHQTDAVADMVKELQYGDPDQAAEKAKTTITAIVRDVVKQETDGEQVRQDLNRDLDTYQTFLKDNAALAADKKASAVIRENLLDGYREDLRKIGVPEDKIPADAGQLAAHHRHYKLQGQPVRNIGTLLATAKDDYLNWKGSASTEPKPTPPPSTPRVNVTVNRDERRMAIPNNPTRATVPPQMVQQQKPNGQTNRQNAVVRMRMARGQPVAN